MNDADIDQMLGRLRAVASRVDPVPAGVVAAARGAFRWRTIDAELAELVYDSWVDDVALVGVRATGGPRQLTFEAPGLTVEVEFVDGAEPRLVGQVVPGGPGTVEVRHHGGSTIVEVDGLGRFAAEHVLAGPVSLRCSTATAPPVETEWVAV